MNRAQYVGGDYGQGWIGASKAQSTAPIVQNTNSGNDLWTWGGAPKGSMIFNGKLVPDPYYIWKSLNYTSGWLGMVYIDQSTGYPVYAYEDPYTGKIIYYYVDPKTGKPAYTNLYSSIYPIAYLNAYPSAYSNLYFGESYPYYSYPYNGFMNNEYPYYDYPYYGNSYAGSADPFYSLNYWL